MLRARQSNAEKKRQDVRQERCVGKPRMRVAREISRKQALRLERGLASDVSLLSCAFCHFKHFDACLQQN